MEFSSKASNVVFAMSFEIKDVLIMNINFLPFFLCIHTYEELVSYYSFHVKYIFRSYSFYSI